MYSEAEKGAQQDVCTHRRERFCAQTPALIPRSASRLRSPVADRCRQLDRICRCARGHSRYTVPESGGVAPCAGHIHGGCVNRVYGRSWVAELALSRSTIVDRAVSRVDATAFAILVLFRRYSETSASRTVCARAKVYHANHLLFYTADLHKLLNKSCLRPKGNSVSRSHTTCL